MVPTFKTRNQQGGKGEGIRDEKRERGGEEEGKAMKAIRRGWRATKVVKGLWMLVVYGIG